MKGGGSRILAKGMRLRQIVPNALALTDPPPSRARPETRVQIPYLPEKEMACSDSIS